MNLSVEKRLLKRKKGKTMTMMKTFKSNMRRKRIIKKK